MQSSVLPWYALGYRKLLIIKQIEVLKGRETVRRLVLHPTHFKELHRECMNDEQARHDVVLERNGRVSWRGIEIILDTRAHEPYFVTNLARVVPV